MEDEIKYMRIGTSLYKVVRKPGLSGSMTKSNLRFCRTLRHGDRRDRYI